MDGGARGDATAEWDERQKLPMYAMRGLATSVHRMSTAAPVPKSFDGVLLVWLDVPSVEEPLSTSKWCRVRWRPEGYALESVVSVGNTFVARKLWRRQRGSAMVHVSNQMNTRLRVNRGLRFNVDVMMAVINSGLAYGNSGGPFSHPFQSNTDTITDTHNSLIGQTSDRDDSNEMFTRRHVVQAQRFGCR